MLNNVSNNQHSTYILYTYSDRVVEKKNLVLSALLLSVPSTLSAGRIHNDDVALNTVYHLCYAGVLYTFLSATHIHTTHTHARCELLLLLLLPNNKAHDQMR